MTTRIFIDGAAGTTGLEIRERLANRAEFGLVSLSDERRKDPRARRDALNDCDVAIFCLPDDAAREAVSLIENSAVRVIDASTAHRTAPGWAYGFPEMAGSRAALRDAARVSNPGCYPTGFIAVMRPLIAAGLVPADGPITCNAVSGYSGGGRSMIEEFENQKAAHFTPAVFRTYALGLEHKHVEEMRVHAGLNHRPLFAPAVGRFYRGMLVEVPLQSWALPGKPKTADLHAALAKAYDGEALVKVASLEQTAAMKTLDAEILKGLDRLDIFVFGNDQHGQIRLVAALDNLGKGAAGAAVQNLNVMLGLDETAGLNR